MVTGLRVWDVLAACTPLITVLLHLHIVYIFHFMLFHNSGCKCKQAISLGFNGLFPGKHKSLYCVSLAGSRCIDRVSKRVMSEYT